MRYCSSAGVTKSYQMAIPGTGVHTVLSLVIPTTLQCRSKWMFGDQSRFQLRHRWLFRCQVWAPTAATTALALALGNAFCALTRHLGIIRCAF